jgi:hypothetical protein
MLAVQHSFTLDTTFERGDSAALSTCLNWVIIKILFFLVFLKKDSQYRFPGLVGAASVSVEMSGEQPPASPRRLFIKPSLSSKGSHSPDGSQLRKVRQLQIKERRRRRRRKINKPKNKRKKKKQKTKKKAFFFP